MASFYPRSGQREQWTRGIGVTVAATVAHLVLLAVIEPPQVDPAALAKFRVDADINLDEPTDAGSLVEVDDALVDLDCQGAVTMRTAARLALCKVRDDGADCRERAYSRYRIDSVGCRQPLDTPELAEITPTPILEADIVNLPPLEELVDAPEEEEDEPEKEDDPDASGQVVEIAKPDIETRPDEADFRAEYDSKVDKETIKRGRPDGGPPSPPPSDQPPADSPESRADERADAETAPDAEPADAPDDGEDSPAADSEPAVAAAPDPSRTGAPGKPGALSMRAAEQPTERAGEDFGLEEVSPDGLAPRLGRRFDTRQPDGLVGEKGENGGGSRAPRLSARALAPSPETINKIVAQGSDDYLPGIDEGEGTALNAKRWKHATFFNRVKGQVRQNWHPQRAYRMRDPRGNIYGSKDRLTVVTVSLKPDGTLNNVWVAQPSGVDFLDDEAVKAFRLAQPFPNPPGALVDANSELITFRFGFMFQINNRAGWKIFRYR